MGDKKFPVRYELNFYIRNEKPTDVAVSILFIYRRTTYRTRDQNVTDTEPMVV